MALYEHTFLVRPDAAPQAVEAIGEEMKGLIEKAGGKVSKTESWGLRTLTFRMNKNRKAHYVFMNIDAEWAAIAEMERQLKLNEDVLRYLTIRVEAHEDGPSAVLQRRDRDDDRGERSFGGGDRDRGDRDRGDRDRGERRPSRPRDNDNSDSERTSA